MRKLHLLLYSLLLVPVFAQEDFIPPGMSPIETTGISNILALFSGIMILVAILPVIVVYVYFALTLSTIAKKIGTDRVWFAWVPILNIILMAKLSGMSLWTALLFFIPVVNIVIFVLWWMKIAEKRGHPNFLGILMLVPIANLVIPGILAWSDKKEEPKSKVEKPKQSPPIKPPKAPTEEQQTLNKMVNYVKQNLSHGYDLNTIKTTLLEQGFNPQMIEKAIQMSQTQ